MNSSFFGYWLKRKEELNIEIESDFLASVYSSTSNASFGASDVYKMDFLPQNITDADCELNSEDASKVGEYLRGSVRPSISKGYSRYWK